ncbi:MAG: UvrD-helicase domain-containing protein, partial [Umezawaea sp.]
MTPEEAWQEVSKYAATEVPPESVDPDDLVAAAERTPDHYALVSGPDELADILAHPFASWRVFLHGKQRDIAYRESFSGPVMVSGGAGTGKTVTALHRAAFLSDSGRVLLTTFTRNLSDALEQQLALLDHSAERVDVLNVDRFAHRVVRELTGRQPKIVEPRRFQQMWQDAARGTEFSAAFLQREWEQVVIAHAVTDLAGYLACDRRGRGRGISTGQRHRAWQAIEGVLDGLEKSGQRTHLQIAQQASRLLALNGATHRHLVVDEAQD